MFSPASEAVLDVGCGDGKITADFARALPVDTFWA